MGQVGYAVAVSYQPMNLTQLACFVVVEQDFDTRWRLVIEFLKEYHREPPGARQRLLADVPGSTGDERWDVLAARPRDTEDIRQLTQVLGLHIVDDVLASVHEIFPARGTASAAQAPLAGDLPRAGRVTRSTQT
jgi:hypothetical protein